MLKPLIHFDINYYKYPKSICRGYFAKYPIKNGLSLIDSENRLKWIKYFEQNKLVEIINNKLNGILHKHEINDDLLKEHGIFFERFYKTSIKSSIIKDTILNENFQEIERLINDSEEYSHFSKNKHDIFYLITDLSYDSLLYKITQNDKYRSGLVEEWYNLHSTKRNCIICDAEYNLLDTPDWVYFSSNGNKNCCFQCNIIEKPTKAALNKIIPRFVEECGFIPKTNTHPLEYSFSSRLTHDKWISLTKLYGEMGGIDHVKGKFGSWFKGMIDTKAIPNGVKLSPRGIWCLSDDGHQCHSIDEQIIDNWLYANNIQHSREPLYPKHETLNQHGKRRADWKVGEIFIEYFGLVGDIDYDKKMSEKIMLASINNIELIEIYPIDMNFLKNKLGALIENRETGTDHD